MADAVLAIKIVTDFAEGQKGMADATTRVGKMQGALNKMVAPAAVAVGAIGAFGKAAVDAASRTQQAIGAVDSVFGRNAGQVKRWAADSATNLGLAKSEYMELSSVLGASLKNMGVPMSQLAGKTNDLVTLGSDLAATYGGTTKEAVEALGSALRGETDPIERYGVSVKQADIAAQQAADGTDKLTGAAGKQAKTMALLKLINKQTADAQGQFARESDSAAGSAQIAAAQFEDMQSTLGTALLPIVASVTTALGGLFETMARHQTTTKVVIGVIAALAAAILVAAAALKVYTIATQVMAAVSKAAWLTNPIFLVAVAIAAVVAAIVIAYKKSATFRAVVDGVWRAIKTGARAAGQALKAIWRVVWSVLSVYVKVYVAAFRVAFTVVRTIVRVVTRAMRGDFSGAWSALKSGVRAVVAIIKTAFSGVRTAVGNVISRVGDLISKLKAIVLPGAVKSGMEALKTVVGNVIDAVQRLIGWIRDIPVPHIDWPSPPSWLSKVVPGAFSAMAPAARTAGVGTYAAPTGRAASIGARASVSRGGGGPTIIIQGAVDPESTARQIARLLGGHTRRMGGAVA